MRDQLDEEGQKYCDYVTREKALLGRLQNLRTVIELKVWRAKYPVRPRVKKKEIEWSEEKKVVIKSRYRMLDVFVDRARVAFENRDIASMLNIKKELNTYLNKNPI